LQSDELSFKTMRCLTKLGHIAEGKSREVAHAVEQLHDIIKWIKNAVPAR